MAMANTSEIGSETYIDSFLTLFVKQLQHLNPPELPCNDLEQQSESLLNMDNADVASLQVDQLSMASTFIGKTITYIPKGKKREGDNTSTGMVEGVKLEKDGTVSFVIGGDAVPIVNFVEVASPSQWMLAGLFGNTWKR